MSEARFPEIGKILPHAGAAIMLDSLLEEVADGVAARAIVSETHPFWDPELRGVPVWVGLEMMAQSVAAHAGLEGYRSGRKPRVGYLLGTRRFSSTVDVLTAGDVLRIEARRLYLEPSGLAAYDCTICMGDQELARATITAYETEAESSE